MDMNLSKLQKIVKDSKPGVLQSWGYKESDTTQQLNNNSNRTWYIINIKLMNS